MKSMIINVEEKNSVSFSVLGLKEKSVLTQNKQKNKCCIT